MWWGRWKHTDLVMQGFECLAFWQGKRFWKRSIWSLGSAIVYHCHASNSVRQCMSSIAVHKHPIQHVDRPTGSENFGVWRVVHFRAACWCDGGDGSILEGFECLVFWHEKQI